MFNLITQLIAPFKVTAPFCFLTYVSAYISLLCFILVYWLVILDAKQ